MWRYQVDELSDSFRVIAPDLPGFGLSQSQPRDTTNDGILGG